MLSDTKTAPLKERSFVTTYEHTVNSYEVDFQKNLKLSALLSIFQQAANNNADALGFGYEDLEKLNAFWALSKLKVEVDRLPLWNEKITVTTWPKTLDGLFAIRDFVVVDSEGNTLIKATSAWLMLDMILRKPKRIDRAFKSFPGNAEKHGLNEKLEKITPKEEMLIDRELSIKYADIDHNNHVNNVSYITWIMNSFSKRHFEKKQIKALQINFNAEISYGEKVRVLKSWDEQNRYVNYISGIKSSDNTLSFQSKICWR